MAKHISESIRKLIERGDLPRRILTNNPKYSGVVFAWDDTRRGFVADDGSGRVAIAGIVRGLFGTVFFSAPPTPSGNE